MVEYKSFADRALEARAQKDSSNGINAAIGLCVCAGLIIILSDLSGQWVEIGRWAAGAALALALACYVVFKLTGRE